MRTAATALLLLLLAAPAAAQEPRLSDLGGQELNARGLHVLVYHPYPDPQGDPWGFPERTVNGSEVGYMEAEYGSYWYPTTVFDGVERVEGATAFLETYRAYEAIYLDHRIEDAPVRLFVHGVLGDAEAQVTVKAQSKGTPPSALDVRVVLFEDEVGYDGGNGVTLHRFVVRDVLHDGPLAFNATGAAEQSVNATIQPQWRRENLGVVVSIENRDPAAPSHAVGEVLQATTYVFDQTGPTIQDRRGVLLETLSATWCDACIFGDGAVDELANEYGIASSEALAAGTAYVRPFAPRVPELGTGTWETAILVVALGAFVFAFGADLSRVPPARRERWTRRAMLAGVLALSLALILLLAYFLLVNLRIEYVFSYTRRDYPWYYRMAGLWAGQKGTLLIWAAATGLFGLAFLRHGERAAARGALKDDGPTTLRTIRRILLLLLIALTWSTLVARTFAPASEYLLGFRPDGNGLQPVLLTPFMIIHPPIQFLSYAMTGLLFAAGLAHIATGGRSWAALARPWTRVNWLLATIGLGLGGLWAYYVLNFGGFWAWDPVETANLLAWFPLLLLLHAFIHYEKGEHRTIAPLFAVLTLPMVFFSTVATRTGLWVSVHAFTDPTKNFARDPLVRLLNILETSTLLQLLTALLLLSFAASFVAVGFGRTRDLAEPRRKRWRAALLATALALSLALLVDPVALLGLAFQAAHVLTLGQSAPLGLLALGFVAVAAVLLTGPEAAPPPAAETGWRRWVQTGPILLAGILLMGLAFFAIFLLDLAGVNGYDRRVFDERAPFVALPILLTISAHFLHRPYGLRGALGAPLAALGLGLVLSLAFRDHAHVLVVLPALLLVAASSLARFWGLVKESPHSTRRDRATALALIAGALLAFLQWGNPPSRLLGIDVPWAWAVPAHALAAFALLAGAVHAGRPHVTLARWGALALLPLVGPLGLATAAGATALVFSLRPRPTVPFSQALQERKGSLRKSTVYLLHLALAIGLSGYALATYESVATEPFTTGPGSPSVRGYTFEPVEATLVGRDADQDLPREVHTRVRILRDGQPLQEATLVYWLVLDGTPGHYDARVTVVRLATEDLYLFPEAVRLRGQTLTDHVNGATPRDATLEGVDLTVKVLPGVGLVWSGLWMLGLAMTARLAFGGFQIGSKAPAERSARAASPPPAEPSLVPSADFGRR